MELWQRFSMNNRRSVLLAHDCARTDGTQISAAHLCLGIIRLGGGKAYQRLKALPDLPALTERLQTLAMQAPEGEEENICFTPEAQRVITRAYQTAKEEGAEQIETRHLLAGLLREAEVRGVLREAGLGE